MPCCGVHPTCCWLLVVVVGCTCSPAVWRCVRWLLRKRFSFYRFIASRLVSSSCCFVRPVSQCLLQEVFFSQPFFMRILLWSSINSRLRHNSLYPFRMKNQDGHCVYCWWRSVEITLLCEDKTSFQPADCLLASPKKIFLVRHGKQMDKWQIVWSTSSIYSYQSTVGAENMLTWKQTFTQATYTCTSQQRHGVGRGGRG